jgi:hypothetical protein
MPGILARRYEHLSRFSKINKTKLTCLIVQNGSTAASLDPNNTVSPYISLPSALIPFLDNTCQKLSVGVVKPSQTSLFLLRLVWIPFARLGRTEKAQVRRLLSTTVGKLCLPPRNTLVPFGARFPVVDCLVPFFLHTSGRQKAMISPPGDTSVWVAPCETVLHAGPALSSQGWEAPAAIAWLAVVVVGSFCVALDGYAGERSSREGSIDALSLVVGYGNSATELSPSM